MDQAFYVTARSGKSYELKAHELRSFWLALEVSYGAGGHLGSPHITTNREAANWHPGLGLSYEHWSNAPIRD